LSEEYGMSTKNVAAKRKVAPARAAVARKPAAASPAALKPAPVAKAIAARPGKKGKKTKGGKAEHKVKVIRDSFTMPQDDYAKIGELKQVCLKAGVHVKKSELLRAGLHALSNLSVSQLKQAIAQMEQVKTGRPKKN
jgi:hypothetical protein